MTNRWTEEEYRAYTEKHQEKSDFLTAEAQRQARQAARGDGPTTKRESYIQEEACRQIKLLLARYELPESVLCGFDGGSKSEVERGRQLRMGYCVGDPDIHIRAMRGGYGGLFIEIKTTDGRLSKAQTQVITDLQNMGYCVAVAYSIEQVVQAFVNYIEK